MKRILLTVIATILSVTAITGCGGTQVQAFSNPDENIDSKLNEEFIILIALGSNPSTGYNWQAEYNTNLLELVEETFEPGEYAKQGVVGAGGTELFRFKGLNKGTTTITFKYKRSWETEVLETTMFGVEIK